MNDVVANRGLDRAVAKALRRAGRVPWSDAIAAAVGFCILGVIGAALLGIPGVTQYLILLVPAVAMARRFLARRRAAVVLDYIGQALRSGHPLSAWLRTCAQAERGKIAQRLAVIAELLVRGQTLAQALSGALPELSRRDLAILTVAETGGSLPAALLRIRERRDSWRGDRQLDQAYLFYLVVIFLAVTVVLLGDRIFIAPKLWKLWASFHLPLNSILLTLPPTLYRAIGVVLVLILFFWETTFLLAAAVPTRRGFVSTRWLRDILLYHLPVVGRAYRSGQWATVSVVLAEGVENGQGLPQVLREAAALGGVASRKLTRWAEAVDAGSPPAKAAQHTGIPAGICDCFELREQRLMLGALRYVSATYQSRYQRLCELLRAAMIPVTVLAAGCFVLLVDLSFWLIYTGLVRAIEHRGPY